MDVITTQGSAQVFDNPVERRHNKGEILVDKSKTREREKHAQPLNEGFVHKEHQEKSLKLWAKILSTIIDVKWPLYRQITKQHKPKKIRKQLTNPKQLRKTSN